MDLDDPKDVVRRGYDALSLRYDEAYGAETKYEPLLSDLCKRVPAGGAVLDLGCGSGVPIARSLADAGYRVTGIDISEVQVRRARERVPQADFIQVDATAASFDDASFDAVVSLYALIHIPLAEQPPLLHYAEGGREPGVGVTAAQVGQDEQGLPVRGQAPPAGADLSAALGKLPGQEAQM